MDAIKKRYQRGAECTSALAKWLKRCGLSKIDDPKNDAVWKAYEQSGAIEQALAASDIPAFDPRQEFSIDGLMSYMSVKAGPLLTILAEGDRFKSQLEQRKTKWDAWVSDRALIAIIPEAEFKFSGYDSPREYAKNSPVGLLLRNAGIPGSALEEKIKKEERKFIEGCRVYECKRVYWSFVLDWWKKSAEGEEGKKR